MPHGHIVKREAQCKPEVQVLLALVEATDTANLRPKWVEQVCGIIKSVMGFR